MGKTFKDSKSGKLRQTEKKKKLGIDFSKKTNKLKNKKFKYIEEEEEYENDL